MFAAVERHARNRAIPVVRFKREECREETARKYFKRANQEGRIGVAMVRVAQERTRLCGANRGRPARPRVCA
jgi:hypothetical protein